MLTYEEIMALVLGRTHIKMADLMRFVEFAGDSVSAEVQENVKRLFLEWEADTVTNPLFKFVEFVTGLPGLSRRYNLLSFDLHMFCRSA